MYGRFFTYDNEASTSHGLMIAGFEVNDDIPFAMNREILAGSLNRYRNRINHMGTKWADVLTFQISMIKSVCDNPKQEQMAFTEDEVNNINAWLTSPDYPILFHMYDDEVERDGSGKAILIGNDNNAKTFSLTIAASGYATITLEVQNGVITTLTPSGTGTQAPVPSSITFNDKYMAVNYSSIDYLKKLIGVSVDNIAYEKANRIIWLSLGESGESQAGKYHVLINKDLSMNQKYDYFGLFSDVEPQVMDGEVYGFTATFTTDSPFAWTHEIRKTFQCSDGDTITFSVSSAEKYREIYPAITITPRSGGGKVDVVLHNNVDGYELKLNIPSGEDTVIDCRHSKISNISGVISFEDLGVTDTDYIYWPRLYNGQNSFTVTGDCDVTFVYREPRKVGAY